jgi:hypothetical protein
MGIFCGLHIFHPEFASRFLGGKAGERGELSSQMESQPRKMPILIAKKEDLLSINLDVHPA